MTTIILTSQTLNSGFEPLETLLTEKGYIDPPALDELIETYETRIGPKKRRPGGGPGMVRSSLQRTVAGRRDRSNRTNSALRGRQGEHMVAIENTADTHNMVVCTLCSCYPWTVLGLPPVWYKSAPYRSRSVRDPRSVLEEFGVALPGKQGYQGLGFDRRRSGIWSYPNDRRRRRTGAKSNWPNL